MRGKFIVIEGGDGAGKDANIELLKAEFGEGDITYVKDPGGTALSLSLRDILQHGVGIAREAELFLFLASRAQLVEEIILPALSSGKHVIANRFDLSTMAYQVYGRERKAFEPLLMQISAFARGEAVPDLLVYLDVEPLEGLRRSKMRGEEVTRFEAEAVGFHTRVREGYRAHVGDYGAHVTVDANRPLSEVYADVRRAVGALLLR